MILLLLKEIILAPAQQGGRMRRIGVLMSTAADDPESTYGRR